MKISDRCLSLLRLKKLCFHDGDGKMGAGRERREWKRRIHDG
jgi:hypothetical protein